MFRRIGFLALAAGAIVSGCSKSSDPPNTAAISVPASAASAESGPKVVVTAFLDAIRSGNDEKAMQLLSKLARQKAIETNHCPTPRASDTARYEIGDIEMVGNDGARVACTWTDNDESGKACSDKALWICRHESEGWRVCGVAAIVFPGEDPLLLNFEDPADMEKRQKWLHDEVERRSKPEEPALQATKSSLEAQRKPQDAFQR